MTKSEILLLFCDAAIKKAGKHFTVDGLQVLINKNREKSDGGMKINKESSIYWAATSLQMMLLNSGVKFPVENVIPFRRFRGGN